MRKMDAVKLTIVNTATMASATVFLLGLLIFAGTAQGQIAAPRLNTVIQAAGTPFNPGVLSWNERSLVSFLVVPDVTVEDEDQTTGAITPLGSGSGAGLGVRLIGETFSFAVEAFGVEIDAEPIVNPPLGAKFETGDSLLVFSAKIGDTISVGIGLEGFEDKDTDNNTGVSATVEGGLGNIGGVWMLTDTFFLGGSVGSETVKDDNFGTPALEADHNIARIGAGWYWRDGDGGFHAEVYKEKMEVLEFRDNNGILQFAEEEDSTGVTLEVLFSNFLLGIESLKSTIDTLDPFALPQRVKIEEEEVTLTLGWMPEDGLSIALALVGSEETDDDPTNTTLERIEAAVIGVSWAF